MCAVAANLIRVTRPVPVEAPSITIFAYYFASNEGATGKIYSYEYDTTGTLVAGPFVITLPTRGVFTDFVFSDGSFGQAVYDGEPGLLVRETTRGSAWMLRPRTESILGHIWYNTSPVEMRHYYANGSIYSVRQMGFGGVVELLRFDSDFNFLGVVSTSGAVTISSHTFCTQEHYCVLLSNGNYLRFPLDGDAPEEVTLASHSSSAGAPAPYKTNRAIQPLQSGARFPRVISDDVADIVFLWPDEVPWLRTSASLSINSQSYEDYLLFRHASRVVMGVDNAIVDDSPILDFQLPTIFGKPLVNAGIAGGV